MVDEVVTPATVSPPHTATPRATYNSPMDIVAQVESGDTDVHQKIHDINTEHGTPAQGNFQIIDPTWRTYAAKAGVDLNLYPTAYGAPRYIQAKVASIIPVNQWGDATKNALKAKYPWIDMNKTLGEAQSQALSGGAIASPNDPNAPAAPVADTRSPAQKFADAAKAGDVGGALAALNSGEEKNGKESKGAIGRAADAIGQQQQPRAAASSPMLAPQQDSGGRAQAGQELLSQVLSQGAKPLSWSTQPFGSNAGPQVPGTTLNSGA